jgi:hypothetical protein
MPSSSVSVSCCAALTTALSYLQLMFGITAILVGISVPIMYWMVAAFRPESDPSVLQALNDLGWLSFGGFAWVFVIQLVAICALAFRDGDGKVLPRWYAWICLLQAPVCLPFGLTPFFKTGPFAWNGLIGMYIPITAVALWAMVTVVVLLRALSIERRELAALDSSFGAVPVAAR